MIKKLNIDVKPSGVKGFDSISLNTKIGVPL